MFSMLWLAFPSGIVSVALLVIGVAVARHEDRGDGRAGRFGHRRPGRFALGVILAIIGAVTLAIVVPVLWAIVQLFVQGAPY